MAEALVSTILEQLASLKAKPDSKILPKPDSTILDGLANKFEGILPLLQDAEIRQVRVWLDKLKDTSYDIEDVLDEWSIRMDAKKSKPLEKVCIPCPSDIDVKIRNLSRALDVIDKEKNEHEFSKTEAPKYEHEFSKTEVHLPMVNIHGRNKDWAKLLNLLLTNSRQGPIFPIISIVGMRGSGKTTLAQQAFNNKDVSTHFEKKIWVRVSGLSDEISIAKEILKCLEVMTLNLDRLETLFEQIRQSFQGIKFLLVLDDVCITGPKIWKEMRNLLKYNCQGSKILITIREQDNVKMVGNTSLISLEKISDEECWSLFKKLSLFAFAEINSKEHSKLENIGKQIVSKCDGLPLILRLLGGLLRLERGIEKKELETRIEKWENILASNFWELEVEKGFFSSLFLSFYDLPITLRKCLLCCAIFPKNYNLEKDTLIKLWMAQGYLKANEGEDLEKVGEKYFQNLAWRSFFHDFQINEHNNKTTSFKMPDLIHDFVQSQAKNECRIIEFDGLTESQFKCTKKIRHIKITEKSNPTSGFKKGKLSSLVTCGINSKVGVDLSKLFQQFTCLRSLDLSDCLFEDLSGEIKNLIHLRYLNLSRNKAIKELPEALYGLYSLQTLNISNCDGLKNLQPGIGKLTNLLHLINYGTPLSYVPNEVKELTCLRTLNKFAVCDEKDDKRACKLEFLGKLKDLEGFLIITGLGNVSAADDVNNAKLNEKKSLVGLGLRFNGLTHVDDAELFKGLKPPPSLEELMVQYYIGQSICLAPLKSLNKLKVLKLSFCLEFEHLPPLGELTCLESLYIANMKNVKRVGKGFSSASTGTGTVPPFFSSLRTLKFESMDEWEIWEDTIMPCLQSLTIGHCRKLKALPEIALPAKILGATTLKKLSMYNCSLLNERYNKNTGEKWSIISDIPNIKIDGEHVKKTTIEFLDAKV